MLKIEDKASCSGCGACEAICPVKAISLVADEEGFLYPEVAGQKCIECGKCVSVCAVSIAKEVVHQGENKVAYAAYIKDEQTRQESSSGGVFSELAKAVLATGGVVFGAAFDEHFTVKHICIDHVDDLNKLRGSKYVQSETGTTYLKAKEYLEQGRTVLYTGTPCQIAGLHTFLGKEYENLLTQDIICHGVPSPMVWKKYVEFREKKAGATMKEAYFRYKEHGWKQYSICIKFENRMQYEQDKTDDAYMRAFLCDLCLRPSCYHCAFKGVQRLSDITLADFWGIEHVCPELDDDKGTSLVILHSEKGKACFDRIKERLVCRVVDMTQSIQYNSAMCASVPEKTDRGAFIRTVRERGFSGAKKYISVPFVQKLKKTLKRMLRR